MVYNDEDKFIGEKGNKLPNLKQIRDDYRNGYSPMGHPSRGYYVTSYRGMESLQAYASNKVATLTGLVGENIDFNVRDVHIEDEGKYYRMKSWSEFGYADVLDSSLGIMKEDLILGASRNSKHVNPEIYDSIIRYVYDGNLDREAFVDAMIDADGDMGTFIDDTFKGDILLARDGELNERSQAAMNAYEDVMAKSVGSVDFGDDSDFGGPELNESQYQVKISQDEWYRRAKVQYAQNILDEYPNSTPTEVKIDDGLDMIERVATRGGPSQLHYQRNREDWDKVIDYLQEGIAFVFEPDERYIIGKGMTLQDEVENRFNESYVNTEYDPIPEIDFGDDYQKFEDIDDFELDF